MKKELNEELISVEIWDAATNNWQAYDCPKNGDTVAEYADWCIGEDSVYWATVNSPEDRIRLNGWYIINGSDHF